MIRQVHVNECDSTQDLLKEQLNNRIDSTPILVSCENQISGRGRGENKWASMPGTLCFSLTITPHPVISFTAIEISVIIAKFFENKGKTIKLKWPNDLWNERDKKCGGILVQGSQNNLLAGIGINLFSHDPQYGGVFESEFEIDKKIWSKDIADFIQNNRYEDTILLKDDWIKNCGHLNRQVEVSEAGVLFKGFFQGLGENGEALISNNNQITRIYNGSIRTT